MNQIATQLVMKIYNLKFKINKQPSEILAIIFNSVIEWFYMRKL